MKNMVVLSVATAFTLWGQGAKAVDTNVRFKAQHSLRYLTVTGLLDNYPVMQRQTTADDSRQIFTVKPVSGAVVTLVNASSGKCATVVGTATQNWAAIILKPCVQSEAQNFNLTKTSTGIYELRTFGSSAGSCAAIHSGSLESGARLIQMVCDGSGSQRFAATDIATGKPFDISSTPAATPTPAPTATPKPTATPAPTATPLPSTTNSGGTTITTQAAFESALANAKGGEKFLLSGSFTLRLTGRTFATPVMLTSLTPGARANINYANLSNVSGMIFKEIDFHANGTNPESYMHRMQGCTDLLFDSVHVYGSLDGNPSNDAIGLLLYGDRITIQDSEFEQLNKGFSIGGTNIKILRNSIHDMRQDGINVGQVSGILVEGNFIRNFGFQSGDHRDGMQFMTVSSSRSSTDIVIRNNIIMLGTGSSMQGIFLTDQVGTLPYQRVKIQNNLVVQTYMANGIMVSNGQDIEVSYNTVVSATDDTNPVWIRMNGITNLTLVGNIAETGGNKTPAQAGIDMSLLTTAKLPYLKPEQLIVPGFGFQGW